MLIISVTETVPKLSIFKNIQERLQETNDVPEMICSVRQAFIKLKLCK